MNIKRKTLRWLDLVSVLGIIFTSLGWASSHYQWFTDAPYTNVRNTSAVWDTRSSRILNVRATYELSKKSCLIDPPIMVFGFSFKERVPLPYKEIVGTNQKEQRYPGFQKMYLRVDTGNLIIDRIQVWTRHNCKKNGELVSIDTLLLEEKVEQRKFSDSFETRQPSDVRK